MFSTPASSTTARPPEFRTIGWYPCDCKYSIPAPTWGKRWSWMPSTTVSSWTQVRTVAGLLPDPTSSHSVSSAANDSSAERFFALKDWSQKRQLVCCENKLIFILLKSNLLNSSLPDSCLAEKQVQQ